MSVFYRPDVERIMRWLHANGSTHQANQIIEGSVYRESGYITYEILVPPGRHRVYLPEVVSYHKA